MGWFDGWFGSGSTGNDPFQKLDPKLREFLEKESPVKYHNSTASQSQAPSQPPPKSLPTPAPAPQDTTFSALPSDTPQAAVPRESLYQDGRYAHLWATYRPQAAVEAETKTDHEKLMDVLDGYKERKAQISKAALENCALEQDDWRECMNGGTVTERMTMCRDKVRRFERCYNQQARLLKALGYLSTYDRPQEVNEKIQMHADTLYHRMLDQEAAMEKAKKEGLPAPQFPPLFGRSPAAPAGTAATVTAARSSHADLDLASLTPEEQRQWHARLDKVPAEDRQAEEEAMKAEHMARAEMADRVRGIWQEQAREREMRKTMGQETIYDKVSGWFSGGPKKE